MCPCMHTKGTEGLSMVLFIHDGSTLLSCVHSNRAFRLSSATHKPRESERERRERKLCKSSDEEVRDTHPEREWQRSKTETEKRSRNVSP